MRLYILSLLTLLHLSAYAEGVRPDTALDYRRDQNTIILVLKPKQKLIASLKALQVKENIPAATLSAIGAVKNVTLAYFDVGQKKYQTRNFPRPVELISLQGNLGWYEKVPWVHCHVAIGDDQFGVRGGHLEEAEVSATTEIFIQTLTTPLQRRQNNEVGLKLIELDAK